MPDGVYVYVGLPADPTAGALLVLMVRSHVPTIALGGLGAGRTRALDEFVAVWPLRAIVLTVNVWMPGVSQEVTR